MSTDERIYRIGLNVLIVAGLVLAPFCALGLVHTEVGWGLLLLAIMWIGVGATLQRTAARDAARREQVQD